MPTPSTLLGGPLRALELVGATLDDALRALLANDASVPAALPLALLMNVAATQVRPSGRRAARPRPTRSAGRTRRCGDPWVRAESPVSSIDDRVTQAVLAG